MKKYAEIVNAINVPPGEDTKYPNINMDKKTIKLPDVIQ